MKILILEKHIGSLIQKWYSIEGCVMNGYFQSCHGDSEAEDSTSFGEMIKV